MATLETIEGAILVDDADLDASAGPGTDGRVTVDILLILAEQDDPRAGGAVGFALSPVEDGFAVGGRIIAFGNIIEEHKYDVGIETVYAPGPS